MAGSSSIDEKSDNPVAINITAMVDVIFCLCLFFMCSFHFKQLEGKIKADLPKDKGPADFEELIPCRDEIRVFLRADPATGAIQRKVRHFVWAASDDELVSHLVQLRDGYTAAGNDDWKLVIDSKPNVPWEDVIHVMDLCKENEIDRIEFAAPEIEIAPAPKP